MHAESTLTEGSENTEFPGQGPESNKCTTHGYMRLEHGDANRFFQLINRRYTRSSMIVTGNKRVSEWAQLLGDEVQAVAILDRLLHDPRSSPSMAHPGDSAAAATSSTSNQVGQGTPRTVQPGRRRPSPSAVPSGRT
jgi:hypothetical protein